MTEDEFRATLAPFSSAHGSRAVAALREELTAYATRFPGTRLQFRFAVSDHPVRTDG